VAFCHSLEVIISAPKLTHIRKESQTYKA
jgi:hypothetical protein